MPILGSLLVTLFSGLFTFFAKYFGLRLAAIAAALATFTTMTVAFYAALAALMAGISATFPPMAMTGVWMFVPDNAPLCFMACIATDTACALYRWNAQNLKIAAFTA